MKRKECASVHAFRLLRLPVFPWAFVASPFAFGYPKGQFIVWYQLLYTLFPGPVFA